MRIGIDVGGTFTDIVLVDDRAGNIFHAKVDTTPGNLATGVLKGVEKILALSGLDHKELDYIVHGTTIGTNALIERKGVKTGLITTEGFVDVLEIGRIQRPKEALYDFFIDNPAPLIPRYLRKGVVERIGSHGEVVLPLEESTVREAVESLKKENVDSIAVCLLFSFLHPEHEQRIREIIEEMYPGVFISLSSKIAPEFREYERTSTTVINAYLLPILQQYINDLTDKLNSAYGDVDLRIMIASGGSMAAETAKWYAVNTVNSGPAGGALAGSYIGSLTKRDHIITVDMGGTSFDISLTDKGLPNVTNDGNFEGYPVKIPIIDIHAIGAGGGSIAWVDKGGALNVGPQSAGAQPGPACYGRGGKKPTVTDANLVLGRLNPAYFLGGEMKLDRDASEKALQDHVAGPLKMSVEEAAAGIIKLVNANMVKGISVVSIERGYDLREFTLVAFGGAGGLHAAEIARENGISELIIPPFAGEFSALGLLVSDTRHDFVQTIMKEKSEADPAEMTRIFKQLEQQGIDTLKKQRVAENDIEIQWSVDLRFRGQSYEINTPVTRKETLTQDDLVAIMREFNDIHERIYAYGSMDESMEFVNLRVIALGRSPDVKLKTSDTSQSDGDPRKENRSVYFEGLGYHDTPIYERNLMPAGYKINGPAVIEESSSSTVLIPDSTATIDEYNNIVINIK